MDNNVRVRCYGTTKAGKPCKWRHNSPCPHHSQEGGKIMDYVMAPVYAVSNRVYGFSEGPRKKETERFRSFLNNHKGEKIVHSFQGRQPVNSIVQVGVNGLSHGRYKRKLKELGEKTAWHDFMIVELEGGQKYRIEKDHVVREHRASKADFEHTMREIPVTKELDLPTMFDTASKGDKDFWKYSASNRNCQDFAQTVLQRNGLEPSPDLPKQDARTLVNTIVGGDHTTNAITNLANRVDRLVYGDGVASRKFKAAVMPIYHDLNHPEIARVGAGWQRVDPHLTKDLALI